MSEAWFYQRGDQRLGPVSSQELKRLADTGELQPTDLLWKEGMPKPLAASRAKGLFSAAVHQEATTPPSAASPAPPPLPADDMPLPSQQPDPDLTLMRGQDTLAVAIPASFDKKQLAQKIQQLRHDVIQNVLGGEPSLPSSPLIDSIRAATLAASRSDRQGTRPHSAAIRGESSVRTIGKGVRTKTEGACRRGITVGGARQALGPCRLPGASCRRGRQPAMLRRSHRLAGEDRGTPCGIRPDCPT